MDTFTPPATARSFPLNGGPQLGMPIPVQDAATFDATEAVQGLYAAGIVAVRETFSTSWAQQLHLDCERLFAAAMQTERGVADRGRNRHYFAVHPEELPGFVEVMTNPIFTCICESMFGETWQLVEVGFDVNRPGSRYQYWHRDFKVVPPETLDLKKITSLAFNFSTVDVTPEMGPFEVVSGTHFDHPLNPDGTPWIREMFPGYGLYERYEAHKQRSYGKQGNMSVRSAAGIHHGTPNTVPYEGELPRDRFVEGDRPVLIIGVVAEELGPQPHPLYFTHACYDALPAELRPHLRWAERVNALQPLRQSHDFEGLMMGNVESKLPEVQAFRQKMVDHGWVP